MVFVSRGRGRGAARGRGRGVGEVSFQSRPAPGRNDAPNRRHGSPQHFEDRPEARHEQVLQHRKRFKKKHVNFQF